MMQYSSFVTSRLEYSFGKRTNTPEYMGISISEKM
jgi:hypothetical protein